MSTRAERSATNRAAHAVKRAQLEEQWALAAAEKQADRKRRCDENRAAWWARYGMAVPGTEQVEQVETSDHVTMPEVTEDSAVIAASATRSRGEAGHWFVELNGVKCGHYLVEWHAARLRDARGRKLPMRNRGAGARYRRALRDGLRRAFERYCTV